MSRGPGHVETTIEALFTENPTATFSTSELIAAVYPKVKQIAKKHRVAVLRAGTKVAARLGNWGKMKCDRWLRDDTTDLGVIFANVCDFHSYALGRLRTEDRRRTPVKTLARNLKHDPKLKELTRPGGIWWMFVQQERAARGAVLDAKTRRLVEIAEVERQKIAASILGTPKT
jgi:hypothetical protein